MLDLLAELQTISKQFKFLSEANQRQLAFAPGANHRLRKCQTAADSPTLLLVFFELVPSGQLNHVTTAGLPLTFWIWVQFEERQNQLRASILHIEPIRMQDHALIDFMPSFHVRSNTQVSNLFHHANDAMNTSGVTESDPKVITLGNSKH